MHKSLKIIANKLDIPIKLVRIITFKGQLKNNTGFGGYHGIFLNKRFCKKACNHMKKTLIHEYIHYIFYGSGIRGYDITLLGYVPNMTKAQQDKYLKNLITLEQNTDLLAMAFLYEVDKRSLKGLGCQYFKDSDEDLMKWFRKYTFEVKVPFFK
jgi:hypothetical protein